MLPKLPLSVSLLSAVVVQLACQAFKVVLYSIREKRPAFSWFISAGGMPSAHSAFVTSLAVSVGLWNGFASEIFAVACVFAIIIIYDAFRLRGAVAHHARVLSRLVARHPDLQEGPINVNVGHTLPEILVGILTGGGFAVIVYLIVRSL
jgi:uncharacterized protein